MSGRVAGPEPLAAKDAALWTPPPARRPGQKGRPRRRGERLPSPSLWAAARRGWHRLTLTLYGRPVSSQVFTKTAWWYVIKEAKLAGALRRDVRAGDGAAILMAVADGLVVQRACAAILAFPGDPLAEAERMLTSWQRVPDAD